MNFSAIAQYRQNFSLCFYNSCDLSERHICLTNNDESLSLAILAGCTQNLLKRVKQIFYCLDGLLVLIVMAEAQHAVINGHQHGLKNLKSDQHLTQSNELCAPSHSRSNSSDSGEGLVLSATDLQARSAHSAVAKINYNISQRSELHFCDSKSLGTMGQAGNSAKPCLEHREGISAFQRRFNLFV